MTETFPGWGFFAGSACAENGASIKAARSAVSATIFFFMIILFRSTFILMSFFKDLR